MRCKDSQEQLSYLKEASLRGNLEMVYASLDILGSTPWKVNREIFDVVLQVWNTGERLGKIPAAVCQHPEPEKPENYDVDPKARSIYLARHKNYLTAKANNHSDRCNTNYKIEIARTVRPISLHSKLRLTHYSASSLAIRSTFLTTSTSVVGRTQSLLISIISATILPEDYSSLATPSL